MKTLMSIFNVKIQNLHCIQVSSLEWSAPMIKMTWAFSGHAQQKHNNRNKPYSLQNKSYFCTDTFLSQRPRCSNYRRR